MAKDARKPAAGTPATAVPATEPAAGRGERARPGARPAPLHAPGTAKGVSEATRAATEEASRIATRIARGTELLSRVRDEDVAIATTPKDEVWRQDKVTLYRYRPLAEPKVRVPVLICYGLIGRYTMADLQEDRSLVRNLLNRGVDLYVIDWGNPSRADRWLTLDDYIEGYLGDAVDVIRERSDSDKVSLLGICEGGVFTTSYAALEPEKVQTLTLTITPIDFHADAQEDRPGFGFINRWTRNIDPADIDRLIEAHGSLPGDFMGAVFNMMTPMRSMLKYNLDLLEVVDDEKKLLNFLRMEKWIADRPDHPGEAAKQWLKDLYQQNRLARNAFELNGRRVDLGNITMPVLNVYAKDDHIIPPATSRALGPLVGTKDYTELALPGGHVGVFVGGRSQTLLGPGIADWLSARDDARDAQPG